VPVADASGAPHLGTSDIIWISHHQNPKMKLGIVYIITFISLTLPIDTSASIKRMCIVQYQTEDGWSKEYKMEAEFVTGSELNERTHSYKYKTFKNYCLLWFSDGGVAIEEINEYVTTSSEFDHGAFKDLFSYRQYIECSQINSDKDDGPKWKITAKTYGVFIDPREAE
jgi:hypothetical protein